MNVTIDSMLRGPTTKMQMSSETFAVAVDKFVAATDTQAQAADEQLTAAEEQKAAAASGGSSGGELSFGGGSGQYYEGKWYNPITGAYDSDTQWKQTVYLGGGGTVWTDEDGTEVNA